MSSSLAPSALGDWNTSPAFAAALSARLPYVYRTDGDGGGQWASTSEALPDVLGWPSGWEARVEGTQVRADAPGAACAYLDVHGRDPERPDVVRGTTIAVSNRAGW